MVQLVDHSFIVRIILCNPPEVWGSTLLDVIILYLSYILWSCDSIIPCGMVVESISWFHVDSRWKFHMEWWNPHGIHDIPHGFQVEWNHKNGWDLSQNIFHMEWVEWHGFHMDSTWIPHGIWGHSKDLTISFIFSNSSRNDGERTRDKGSGRGIAWGVTSYDILLSAWAWVR
jgi:hypothetical protein